MPPVRQSIRVIPATNRISRKKKYIVIHKKTGFMDLWLNGNHYYYNLVASADSGIPIKQIRNYQNMTGKKMILVRRKRAKRSN